LAKIKQIKQTHDEWLDKINQLDNNSVRNLILLILIELEEWSEDDKALAIIKGYTSMLLNRFSFLIDTQINKINKGEEQ